MKKYLFLSIAGFLGLFALVYLYKNSESSLIQQHQQALALFTAAKQGNATLDKDILRAQAFLLPNFDPIVQGEKQLETVCSDMLSTHSPIYRVVSPELDTALKSYCSTIEKKLEGIELFKSRNAVYRNSLYFIRKLAVESNHADDRKSRNKAHHQSLDLIRIALSYSVVSDEETRHALQELLTHAAKFSAVPGDDGDRLLLATSHTTKILSEKAAIDALVADILNEEMSTLLEKIAGMYFVAYREAETKASLYMNLLFGTCIVLLLFTLYNVTSLWKAARQLSDANANLERRVEERTAELKNSQQTITQQQQTLSSSAKMSALGEMAGGVAHEINNPLAIIKQLSSQLGELLTDDPIDAKLIAEMNAKVEKTADRIAIIVKGLRTFSRDASNDPFQRVSVNTLVENTVSLCKERFKNHSIPLTIDTFAQDLSFEGRETEISQVILNLLNNSHDAVADLKNKWVKISVNERDDAVEISIADSGAGIPAAIREKIFQPFFTTKQIGKGTGLGLAISLGIIKNHHGELAIDATSANTCFVIRLPKKHRAETHAA